MTDVDPTQRHQVDGGSPKLAWVLLFAAAVGRPLALWASNVHVGVSISKLALHAVLSLALAALVFTLLGQLDIAAIPSAICSVIVLLLLVNFGSLQERTGGLGFLVVVAGIWLVIRLAESSLMPGLAVVLTAVMGVAPATQLLMAFAQGGSAHVAGAEPVERGSSSGHVDDVVIVIMDQFAGLPFLEAYGHDPTLFVEDLRSAGMAVPESGWSTATTTYVSIPEMLNMKTFLPDGVVAVPADYEVSYQTMAGDNRLVRSLKSAGYTYTHIESGWEGTRCGPLVDDCVSAPWLDATAWELWHPSLLGQRLVSAIGHPFIHGALAAVQALEQELEELQANERRDFLFAHILLPHAPFLLNADCERRDEKLATDGGHDPHGAYVAQVTCAENIVRRVVADTRSSTAMLITGDHGNSTTEVGILPADWSDLALSERLSTFMAYRLPDGCAPPQDSVTTVVVASLAHCAVEGTRFETSPTFTAALYDLPGVHEHRVYRVPSDRVERLRSAPPIELLVADEAPASP